jgi:zinc protease
MRAANDPLRVEYSEAANGLRIARQAPPPGSASISATYVGPAGWGFDTDREGGAARLVNQLVTSAAGAHDRVALARLLDRAGATLTRQCAPESAEVTIWGPEDEWELLLRILSDVVVRPRFDPADVARVRRQALERHLRELTQPAARAERELMQSVFPTGHPYRSTGTGDRRSLERLRRTDLVAFHRGHYVAADAVLVVTAPARLREIERVVRREFSGLPDTAQPQLVFPRVKGPRGEERRIELPGHSQVEIRLGGSSIPRSAPEYPAAFLANEVLGGRPLLSRLFQRVRERGGLAYHATSDLEAMRFGGYWEAQAGTGADRWQKVVPMLRGELKRLDSSEVRPGELDAIRESAIGEIPLSLESTSDAHELAVELAYHRLPEDYLLGWPERLREVRPGQVREAAEVALDGTRASLVLVGPLDGR